MRLKHYVEMKDTDKNNESPIVDIYGYEDRVLVWTYGYSETFPTKGIEETQKRMQWIIDKLMDNQFVIINQEVLNQENNQEVTN